MWSVEWKGGSIEIYIELLQFFLLYQLVSKYI